MYPVRKRKNLDFRKVEKQKHREETARRRGKSMLLLLPLVLLVVYLQNYIYYMEKTDEMERQILEVQSYLNNRGVIEREERLDLLQSNLGLLGRYEEEIESLREPERGEKGAGIFDGGDIEPCGSTDGGTAGDGAGWEFPHPL